MNEAYAKIIIDSYFKWLGKVLLDIDQSQSLLKQLDDAPFAILSHGTEVDPILNYGNKFALELWEMDEATFKSTPSRLTAEPMIREARANFMKQVTENGFVSGYTGIRISKPGRRFYIKDAVVFNLVCEQQEYAGQAAMFKLFEYID